MRHEELVRLDTDRPRIRHVEVVLRVDERAHAAVRLRLRDRVEREPLLAARLRAVHLDDAAARMAADTGGEIQRE